MTLALVDLIPLCQARTDSLFTHYLQKSALSAPKLAEAMSYSVLSSGKRIRPLLVYATGLTLNTAIDDLDAPAAAVELIHTYSLLHDDLPAMDNANFRRGKPSCHKAHGEAMAILAGDALQPLAFEIIAIHPTTLTSDQRLAMIAQLSNACGLEGMAGGQALDIATTNYSSNPDDLIKLYRLKTGALLSASVKLGMLAANHVEKETVRVLDIYANNLGLAFQIQDDLLDLESNIDTLGKPQGLDTINNKKTYPFLFSVTTAKQKIQELTDNALKILKTLRRPAPILEQLAEYLLQRKF
jgi:farnesyl diphosphate synthase